MSKYKHQRGNITDNALKALLRDPLFKQRIEKNKKGKGSYQRKEKGFKGDWEANGKNAIVTFTIGLLKFERSIMTDYFAL